MPQHLPFITSIPCPLCGIICLMKIGFDWSDFDLHYSLKIQSNTGLLVSPLRALTIDFPDNAELG